MATNRTVRNQIQSCEGTHCNPYKTGCDGSLGIGQGNIYFIDKYFFNYSKTKCGFLYLTVLILSSPPPSPKKKTNKHCLQQRLRFTGCPDSSCDIRTYQCWLKRETGITQNLYITSCFLIRHQLANSYPGQTECNGMNSSSSNQNRVFQWQTS